MFVMGSMCCIVNSLSDLPSLKCVSFGSDFCLSKFEIVVLKSALL